MIEMNKSDFNKTIANIVNQLFEEEKLKIAEWRSRDNKPAIVNELPAEDKEPSVIDTKSDLQVVDQTMPIEDDEWVPGNPEELGRAMKQMSGMVPETQIDWFYAKLRRLIDSSIDKEDEAKMKPRLGDGLE